MNEIDINPIYETIIAHFSKDLRGYAGVHKENQGSILCKGPSEKHLLINAGPKEITLEEMLKPNSDPWHANVPIGKIAYKGSGHIEILCYFEDRDKIMRALGKAIDKVTGGDVVYYTPIKGSSMDILHENSKIKYRL